MSVFFHSQSLYVGSSATKALKDEFWSVLWEIERAIPMEGDAQTMLSPRIYQLIPLVYRVSVQWNSVWKLNRMSWSHRCADIDLLFPFLIDFKALVRREIFSKRSLPSSQKTH